MGDLAGKHLDYLQAAITRMASNSFLARGWSVTLSAALLGLAVNKGGAPLALLALLPVVLFWLFDAYFLALERGFRRLFAAAARAALAGGETTLDMNPGPIRAGDVLGCAFRPVTLLSHGTILLSVAAVTWLLCRVPL